jgi:hypothetical protein
VTTPRAPRPTATVRDVDGRPLDRDTYARALAEQANPSTPWEGDRVRITYGDGSTAEGRWECVGGDVEDYGLVLDDGTVHTRSGGQVARVILGRVDRPLLPLLMQGEAAAIAALLDELAGVYRGEPLGQVARQLATTLYGRLEI